MTRLQAAIEAADARKRAALGDEQNGLVMADDPLQARAIFSGFGLDYDELVQTASALAAVLYSSYCQGVVGVRPLLESAWRDGLLIGMMVAKLVEDDGSK